MKLLNNEWLNEDFSSQYQRMKQEPVKVLQIGEGNFLRGFFDWMLHECRKQGLYKGSVAVIQPRPGGRTKINALASQDGLYTLVIRGLEHGERVEKSEVISVFGKVFDPYCEWNLFLALAEEPELQVVVSNTTEAGLQYTPEELIEGVPIQSFPGKLTRFLYHRYITFHGDPQKGLICLPSELLERNGDKLLEYVLQYSDDWGYPYEFKQWVIEHNRFLNSLVDRIVTGYPDPEQAEDWFKEWGYKDPLLCTAEPYHLWAIEGECELESILPLASAGLNVKWVNDLTPYQLRKVRILNGAHTLMAPLGLLHGTEYVRETMEHSLIGNLVRNTIEMEVIPSLPYDENELKSYAEEVYERFLNPFIRHRLSDIAMNSLSKFKARLLPSLLNYRCKGDSIPYGLALGFAALLRYYKIKMTDKGYEGVTPSGITYSVRDNAEMLETIALIWLNAEKQQQSLEQVVHALLGLKFVWGQNLAETWPELVEVLALLIRKLECEINEKLG